ncbi:MAG TPA: ATPase domain-containing protein [Casimicrobiaceae bacterium]|nr:ATPase domain-containing protein [Casimicrobiaceae bacterium]
MARSSESSRAGTGIEGLNDILREGLVSNRLYLVEGSPGSGKTTLAFQFLLEGVRCGEKVLHITLSESEEEIRAVAASHGWSLEGITIRPLMPSEAELSTEEQYTVFHPSEIELSETTRKILEEVKRHRPSRVVIDSLSELRLLSGDALRYRRQILALKQFFAGQRCTVLVLDDLTAADRDLQVQSIAHGAMLLEHEKPSFGSLRRRLSITKFRGSDFRAGYHDYVIRRGGIEVYPRLVAAEHRRESSRERLRSEMAGLDSLMGGGLERGTSTLLVGASGTGKSSIAALFADRAAARGERSAMFIFDESANTLYSRMEGLGIDLRKRVDDGMVAVTQIDPAELSPGQFAHAIRRAVAVESTRIVVIDSLNGYLNSMPDESFLIVQLHELLTYLGQAGIATILIATQAGLIGSQMSTPVDASYIADSVVLLRYFEADGEVRQAISVVKMRGGDHERSIREFIMRDGRMWVGEPLRDYRGVFTGVPHKITDRERRTD